MNSSLGKMLRAALPMACLVHAAGGSLIDPFRQGALHKRQFPGQMDESWAQFQPSTSIKWERCYDETRDCARLEVPMHHDDPSSNKTVTLAIIRVNATNTENYHGPILFNPGGPGGSGVTQIAFMSELLMHRLNGTHDIISWDTRGLARSTPRLECWANRQRRAAWEQMVLQDGYAPDFMDSPAWIAQLLARWRIESNLCRDMMDDSGLLPTLNTATHARDIDSIREALGLEKIRFWGFSWGSALGGYYATLFPHRIERFVSEANVDLRRWIGTDRTHDFEDVPRIWNHLLELCAADESCPFHEPTPEAIQARWDNLREDLRLNPRIHFNRRDLPDVANHHVLTSLASNAIIGAYLPWWWFSIAGRLASLEAGDVATDESQWDPTRNLDADLADTRPLDRNDPDGWTSRTLLSDYMTRCLDQPPGPDDPEEIFELLKEAQNRTVMGSIDVLRMLDCTGNLARPENQFLGPFGGNTSFPILFLNAWDSQTPRSGATRNSELFPGSKVVFLDEHGHDATLASPCIHQHVQAYLENGTMPRGNETCKGIEIPSLGGLRTDSGPEMMGERYSLIDLMSF